MYYNYDEDSIGCAENKRMISKKYGTSKKGFTLAEALITLVIIGVIAALTIPSILINTEQNEYRSALKKALSILNQVIELNIALEGYGPIETVDMTSPDDEDSLYNFFRKRMNVLSTSESFDLGGTANYTFFTVDGMRYEFPTTIKIQGGTFATNNGHCGTPDEPSEDMSGTEREAPCVIIVDVNGQRKPNPQKDSSKGYKVPAATSKSKILDVYPIIITDKSAFPYGVVGQRAAFQEK